MWKDETQKEPEKITKSCCKDLGCTYIFCLFSTSDCSDNHEFIYVIYGNFSVGISLLLAMAISSLVGTLVPLFFHKIKIDPAVASGPLITTVNDLVAVITYYGLAWILLIQIMNIA